jgi:hypothetical protein
MVGYIMPLSWTLYLVENKEFSLEANALPNGREVRQIFKKSTRQAFLNNNFATIRLLLFRFCNKFGASEGENIKIRGNDDATM